MPRRKKHYIDADGVFRGYYVYLHRALEGGEVFYVGKGCGNRAWERTGRNYYWEEKVLSLGGRWEAVIVKDDLSELEAFDLEARLIKEYGGPSSTGGKLANYLPGGENVCSIVLSVDSVDIDPKDRVWNEAYRNARRFRELPRETQEEVVRRLQLSLEPIVETLADIEEAAFDAFDADEADEANYRLFESAGIFVCKLSSRTEIGSDLLLRRISWFDFTFGLEARLDSLISESSEDHHPQVWDLAVKATAELTKLFNEIDSGNRKEAEDAADKAAIAYSQSLEKGD